MAESGASATFSVMRLKRAPALASADGKIRFAGKLVGDIGVGCHLAGVVESRLGKDGIAMEWGKAVSGAVLIGCCQEILLCYFRPSRSLLGGRTAGKGSSGHHKKQNDSKHFMANREDRIVLPH